MGLFIFLLIIYLPFFVLYCFWFCILLISFTLHCVVTFCFISICNESLFIVLNSICNGSFFNCYHFKFVLLLESLFYSSICFAFNCFALYYFLFYCFILYCFALLCIDLLCIYCFTLYCFVLHYFAVYCFILYCFVSYCSCIFSSVYIMPFGFFLDCFFCIVTCFIGVYLCYTFSCSSFQ